ncbi:hypothetical protein KUTeg_001321 [Tegillarca granosa]|uniref:Uncharacterized protein n=1 Tax=Tegillarca granosa TaxID=220873 RepID=A0ABQ9FV69_TEGGR|nr:hypothetical protein KUTeg_001321 [Tegillarca granosa]
MLSPSETEYLDKIWTDPKHAAAFAGPEKLEFDNTIVKNYLKSEDVYLIFTQNETKSNFAERTIQNMKNRMYRMFTEKNSYKYIKDLDNINHTPSRPLKGMTPADVNKTNEDEVRLNAYLRMVLSSKDSAHIYPDNKCFDFRVYLPKQLTLSGNSTISLLEFTYQGTKTSKPELFIYCNLCDDTIVGERELPLLRRIYLKSSDNYIYDQPYEVPLKSVVFQDIQISIKDSNHALASFLQGEVTLTLQLKERLF